MAMSGRERCTGHIPAGVVPRMIRSATLERWSRSREGRLYTCRANTTMEVAMRRNAFDVSMRGFLSGVVAELLLSALEEGAQEKTKSGQDQLPKKVMDGLKARFPKAEIDKWEKEEGTVLYDIECKQDSHHCEADIRKDGTILNWEKALAAKELPAAVVKGVDKPYPKATIKEVMQVTAVESRGSGRSSG
jgi:hypothetical protein